MRLTIPILLAAAFLAAAQPPTEEAAAIAVVQKVFDGIAAHDADLIRSTMLPDARIHSVRDAADPAVSTLDAMATQIAAAKTPLLERFTSPPRVLIRGRMAQVWGEYEFLRDGKFTHCGVDTASLFKTAAGWKIVSLSYTVERTGCKGQ
jgi:hypothetical protein